MTVYQTECGDVLPPAVVPSGAGARMLPCLSKSPKELLVEQCIPIRILIAEDLSLIHI